MSALLPVAPLVEIVTERQRVVSRLELAREIATNTGQTEDAVRRFLERLMAGEHKQGISSNTADVIATGLHMHPSVIWGRDWDQPEEQEERVANDSIEQALRGVQTELEDVQDELDGIDTRKAELKARAKELKAAASSLRKLVGRTVPVIGGHPCDECEKVLPTAQGLSTHKSRMHKAA